MYRTPGLLFCQRGDISEIRCRSLHRAPGEMSVSAMVKTKELAGGIKKGAYIFEALQPNIFWWQNSGQSQTLVLFFLGHKTYKSIKQQNFYLPIDVATVI